MLPGSVVHPRFLYRCPAFCHIYSTHQTLTLMLFKALSAAIYGIDANISDVEVDFPGIKTDQGHLYTVGLPDAAVRESRDRVRALSRTPALTCLRRISLSTSPPPTSRREAPASTYPWPSASSAHMEPSSSCLLANSVSTEVSALSPACYPWPSRRVRAASGIW